MLNIVIFFVSFSFVIPFFFLTSPGKFVLNLPVFLLKKRERERAAFYSIFGQPARSTNLKTEKKKRIFLAQWVYKALERSCFPLAHSAAAVELCHILQSVEISRKGQFAFNVTLPFCVCLIVNKRSPSDMKKEEEH